MYKLNNVPLSNYGIQPGRVNGEGIAVRGIFDLPKRIGDIEHSWEDEDSVEPYTDADDIHLGGRDIIFHGFLVGDFDTVKTNIDNFKSDLSNFTSVVPFETPYGTACVFIEQIEPRVHKHSSTIIITFREPVVGASCGVNVVVPVFLSAPYSATATKNDCDEGFHGSEVTLTATAGQFTSNLSQEAANQLAIDWVLENVQLNANINGTCIVNPTVYYNVELSATFTKECPSGFQGTSISYTVEAFTYSSLISQADANAQAQAELDANASQAIANAQGTCQVVYESASIVGGPHKSDCGPGYNNGSTVFSVPAGQFTSLLSQAHADAQAQAFYNLNAQQFADENATCIALSNAPFIISAVNESNSSVKFYQMQVPNPLAIASTYVLVFGQVGVFSSDFRMEIDIPANFLASQVYNALAFAINSKDLAFWNDLFAPHTITLKPIAQAFASYLSLNLYNDKRLKNVWVTD